MRISNYLPIYRRNLRLAFPVVLSQLGQVTVSLVDNMMVGHVGTVELAAAAFSINIFHIGMLLGIGITMGLTPLVGNSYSQKKEQEVGEYLKNGLLVHLLATVLILILMAFISFFLDNMGQPVEVIEKAVPYYLLLVLSLFPMLLFYSFKQFLEGVGNTKIAMYITLTSNLVNIFFNYLLIYGKFGFPELGLNGAGIATLISRIIMPLMLIPFIIKNKQYKREFQIAYHARIQWAKVKEVFSVGLPIGLQIIVEVSTFSFGAIMMGWISKEALAAHQVAIGLASFTYMISLGVGAGTTILVSHARGMGDRMQMRRSIFASAHLVVLFMSIMGIVFVVLRYQLPLLFTDDTEVVAISAGLLIVAALFQIFDGVQVILLASLRGLSDVKHPMFMAFISYMILGLPISYLFGIVLNFGAIGIWIGFLSGLGFAAILFSFRLKRHLW
ncbi:MATE family efflux transporter [Sunxiuqinia elliptica]|uniref:Multidrug-efflux transporter n=1 Tax=Sunxiuqinia elliptica TaxID=655355 RepID=A0A4R6GXB0_9BACT|nr:MATE family efflux transporter [Sunxiuqinia elliptica]TDN99967.1 MATE family multidrug resistance protein [Sunxiuqinia elliptica]TDO57159.1 MATE family multidrug resistance protein [Sunxiuqinia elliptica]